MTSTAWLLWYGRRLEEVSYPSPGQLIMTTKRRIFQSQNAIDRLLTGWFGSRRHGARNAVGFGEVAVVMALPSTPRGVLFGGHKTRKVDGATAGCRRPSGLRREQRLH